MQSFIKDTVLSHGDEDEALVIVTADHGYPDQRRGLTSDGPDLKKSGKAHDLLLTDDNIEKAVRYPISKDGYGTVT